MSSFPISSSPLAPSRVVAARYGDDFRALGARVIPHGSSAVDVEWVTSADLQAARSAFRDAVAGVELRMTGPEDPAVSAGGRGGAYELLKRHPGVARVIDLSTRDIRAVTVLARSDETAHRLRCVLRESFEDGATLHVELERTTRTPMWMPRST